MNLSSFGRLSLAFMGSVSITTLAAGLTVLYVDPGAGELVQDGSSWYEAFADLEHALAAADPGDQVWVANESCV